MTSINVGLVGCGVISEAYLKAAAMFPVLNISACADIRTDAALQRAGEYEIRALGVDEILADPAIDLVLNLTTPEHHVDVGLAAIAAGKHVYSEKPLAVSLDQAGRLAEAATAKGLRIGCAPDTFLGGAHQTARKTIDDGAIGEVLAGTAFLMLPGHERWHPNPDFYYQPGGGPMFDMGPYYLTALVNMIGPIDSVVGMARSSFPTRTIGSGDRSGEEIEVNVDTHVAGVLRFANGALVTITTSFDIKKHGHSHIEIYGSEGSMLVGDPNQFEGVIETSKDTSDWTVVQPAHHYGDGNYRSLGLADMAQAILSDRYHRASLELSLHVLEAMEAILASAREGKSIRLSHQCARPAALPIGLPFGQLD